MPGPVPRDRLKTAKSPVTSTLLPPRAEVLVVWLLSFSPSHFPATRDLARLAWIVGRVQPTSRDCAMDTGHSGGARISTVRRRGDLFAQLGGVFVMVIP
jgi:hypothetical protein